MILGIEDICRMQFIDDTNIDIAEFRVTAVNYCETNDYGCENDHSGAIPALVMNSSSYNPANAMFTVEGAVVYVCPTCKLPVFKIGETII